MSTQEPTLAPSGDVEAMKARVLAQPLIAALVRAIETVDPDLAAEMRSASPTSPDEKMPAFLDALDREWAALHPQATAPLAGQEFDAGELARELERLDREATPGPWRVGTWGNGEHVPGLEHIFLDTIEATIQDVLAEDAALIVALRNNLPTILTALRSTQQPDLLRDEELRGKFRCFLSHATGGRTSDINLPLNDISVMASQKVNDAWEMALEKGRSNLLPLLCEAREALYDLHRECLSFVSKPPTRGRGKELFDRTVAALARIDATLAQEGEGRE